MIKDHMINQKMMLKEDSELLPKSSKFLETTALKLLKIF